MIEDEVVNEVRAIREAFAASHGFDIRAMGAAIRQFTIDQGLEVIRLPSKPVSDPEHGRPRRKRFRSIESIDQASVGYSLDACASRSRRYHPQSNLKVA